ncbi:Myrosinase 1 [Cryptotermes secundus]|uniref:Myrosinase 1 n=2 Tax=Cryptotermes secundus TaxID=105785 RepID=A0A2J7Q4Z3_9NEOP|nr:myrosinase 1 isoform X2 [Cryptotermes secundus]PNF23657.1 Myrosinase 1 [Cryptotermes secundus]
MKFLSACEYEEAAPWRVFLLVAMLMRVTVVANNTFRFPQNFSFSAATSSYQVEGGWNEDGKGVNIWDSETHKHPELISDFSNGDVAADSYHKYTEDIKLLKDLGVQFYRFSISWPRILPNGHVTLVNQAGIHYYNNIINGLLAYGIQPMVTMYHWDLPQALQNLGGWTNIYMVECFEDYARLLYKLFGDRVRWWITINEPLIISQGYAGEKGRAPNINAPGTGDYLTIKTMVLAHARAYRVYLREFKDTQKGKVGIALNINWYEAYANNSEDISAAERTIQYELGLYANPIFSTTGDYPPDLKERIAQNSKAEGFRRSRLPSFTQQEISYIRGTWDFFGLNHYTTVWALAALREPVDLRMKDFGAERIQDPSCPRGSSKWLMTVPWGFRKILRWIKQKYNNPPVFVTECGYSDDGRLQDEERVKYYVEYLREMLKAMYYDGCNVIGFTAWTLLDSFEWRGGYRERFGLFYVNFSDPTRPRIAKESARVYKEIVRTWQVPTRYPQYSYDTQECSPTIPL